MPEVFGKLKHLVAAGYKIVFFTNQVRQKVYLQIKRVGGGGVFCFLFVVVFFVGLFARMRFSIQKQGFISPVCPRCFCIVVHIDAWLSSAMCQFGTHNFSDLCSSGSLHH